MAAAPVMVAMMAVSTAVSAYSSIKQGEAQAAALKYEQQQHQQREQQLRTRALQEEAARREELASNLSTIDAIRAGRGLSGTSPTALVIRDDVTDDAMDSMRISRLNILNGAESERQAGVQAGRAASNALTSGYLRAGTSLLDFGAKAYGMGGFGGTSTPKNIDLLRNTGSKW